MRYEATWAGMPAGEVTLWLTDDESSYAARVEIETTGLPRLLSRFRAKAESSGSWTTAGSALPDGYDAAYEQRRRQRRIVLDFVPGPEVNRLAVRGTADTSKKPPIAEKFRRGVLDPLSALASIRRQLLANGRDGGFTVPVYDGRRRFDVEVRGAERTSLDLGGGTQPVLQLDLLLRPVAGFDDGNVEDEQEPENAPREVLLVMSDDERLVPLKARFMVALLPAVVVASEPARR